MLHTRLPKMGLLVWGTTRIKTEPLMNMDILIPPERSSSIFNSAGDFSKNGLARVWVKGASNENDYQYGYIDSTGRIAIAPQFEEACDFAEKGLALVLVGTKWGYIDATGNFVIEPQFDGGGDFATNGLASVLVGEKWGYIDATGTFAINPRFDTALDFSSNGLALVVVNDQYGYIDSTGTFVTELYEGDL